MKGPFAWIPFPDHRNFFGIFWKSQGFVIFWVSGFLSPGFFPRDSGFLLISGFLSPGFMQNLWDSGFFTFGIYRGFFIPGIGIFFVGWNIPTKSKLWSLDKRFEITELKNLNYYKYASSISNGRYEKNEGKKVIWKFWEKFF